MHSRQWRKICMEKWLEFYIQCTYEHAHMHENIYTWKYDRKHIHLHIKCVTHMFTWTHMHIQIWIHKAHMNLDASSSTSAHTHAHMNTSFCFLQVPPPTSSLPHIHTVQKREGFLGISTKHGILNYTSRMKRVPKQAKESQTALAPPAITPTRRPSYNMYVS